MANNISPLSAVDEALVTHAAIFARWPAVRAVRLIESVLLVKRLYMRQASQLPVQHPDFAPKTPCSVQPAFSSQGFKLACKGLG